MDNTNISMSATSLAILPDLQHAEVVSSHSKLSQHLQQYYLNLRDLQHIQHHQHVPALTDRFISPPLIYYDVSMGDNSDGLKMTLSNTNRSNLFTNNDSLLTSLWPTEFTSSPSLRFSSLSPTFQNESAITTTYIVIFSTLFFIVGIVGITGNMMVVYVVLSDGKMRRSMINMLILNLALADSVIMLFGLPEITMFFMNEGWQLGQAACSVLRTVLVCALYSSVLTLVAVCIERYIAIVFAIKAHILCTKRRVFSVMVIIWVFSGICATPTAVFNRVLQLSATPPRDFCIIQFHMNKSQHQVYNRIFKYTEFVLFYLGPLVLQVACYSVIGKNLFAGVNNLRRNSMSLSRHNGRGPARAFTEAIRARKGVVKMLMASVVIYFISYSPHQILLFYNTFYTSEFDKTWMFHVFTTILTYINSAANPVLYSVFSNNFRSKFRGIFHKFSCYKCCCYRSMTNTQRPITLCSYTEYCTLVHKNTKKQNIIPVVAL